MVVVAVKLCFSLKSQSKQGFDTPNKLKHHVPPRCSFNATHARPTAAASRGRAHMCGCVCIHAQLPISTDPHLLRRPSRPQHAKPICTTHFTSFKPHQRRLPIPRFRCWPLSFQTVSRRSPSCVVVCWWWAIGSVSQSTHQPKPTPNHPQNPTPTPTPLRT